MISPAGIAMRKYAMKTAESTNEDWRVFNRNAFLKCGINIESRLIMSPQKKNRLVTRIKGTRYWFDLLMQLFKAQLKLIIFG
jgi:hypothetical protein